MMARESIRPVSTRLHGIDRSASIRSLQVEREDNDDDRSVMSVQCNSHCQDIAATALSSDEEWKKFKATMRRSSLGGNTAVLHHMQSEARRKCRSSSPTRNSTKRCRRRRKQEYTTEKVEDTELPSVFSAIENQGDKINVSKDTRMNAQRRYSTDNIDDYEWIVQDFEEGIHDEADDEDKEDDNSIEDIVAKKDHKLHLAANPIGMPDEISVCDFSSSSLSVCEAGTLICDFGDRLALHSPEKERISFDIGQVTHENRNRESITSINTLEHVFAAVSAFVDETPSKGELLENFGTRPSRSRNSFSISEAMGHWFGANSNGSSINWNSSHLKDDDLKWHTAKYDSTIIPVKTQESSSAA